MSNSMKGNTNTKGLVFSKERLDKQNEIVKKGWKTRRKNKKYRGVLKKKHGGWVMKIIFHHIVYKMEFETEIEAALAYNELALFAWGDKAKLNVIGHKTMV